MKPRKRLSLGNIDVLLKRGRAFKRRGGGELTDAGRRKFYNEVIASFFAGDPWLGRHIAGYRNKKSRLMPKGIVRLGSPVFLQFERKVMKIQPQHLEKMRRHLLRHGIVKTRAEADRWLERKAEAVKKRTHRLGVKLSAQSFKRTFADKSLVSDYTQARPDFNSASEIINKYMGRIVSLIERQRQFK